jgi:beta-lactamase regulating signal transducer with metallopeptidase domain
MALYPIIADPRAVLMQLGLWALRTSVLALAAELGLAAFRVKSTSIRLFTWTAVLYAAFTIPLLGWLSPSLHLPILPATLHHATPVASIAPAPKGIPTAEVSHQASNHLNAKPTLQTVVPSTRQADRSPVRWSSLGLSLYLGVGLLLLARLAAGLILSGRLVRSARRIRDPRVTSMAGSGISPPRSATQICESERVSVPVTVGAIRSIVLLPSNWRDWDDEKLHAILAHEMSHVARRDAFTQQVSLLHRAVFWFSPLSWWLNRHLADLAEQASDEAALSTGADRAHYARTLLGFFESLQGTPRVWWQGVSMAKPGQAEQRVERILGWRGAFTMRLRKSAVVLIVAFAIPVIYLAASAHPVSRSVMLQVNNAQEPAPSSAPDSQAAPTAPPASQAAPTAAPVAPPLPAPPAVGVSTSGPAPIAPIAPVGPTEPIAPVSSWAEQSSGSGSGRGFSYHYGYDDEQRFVIVTGKTDSFTMSGSSEDARHVEKLRKQIPGDFIWFQRDEKSYIIRDQATIDRANKLWEPQQELGRKQEELGKQQEALGKQQEELGSKMEQVRVKVPDMTAELDRLKAKLQKLGPSATMEQIGDLQSEIGELQSKIGEIQSQAGEEQSRFGQQQGALGEKQGALGRQQGELGRQQGELARKATAEMKQLLDEAIKNGTAKPEPQAPDSSTL